MQRQMTGKAREAGSRSISIGVDVLHFRNGGVTQAAW